VRLISYSQLRAEKGIPFSRPWIDHLIEQGKFPRKVRISPNRRGWLESEIDGYLADCAAERDAEQSSAA
jgi:prophage regulatory protein